MAGVNSLEDKSITPTDHLDLPAAFKDGIDHIQVERLASCAGFFRPVQHSHCLDRMRAVHLAGCSFENGRYRRTLITADFFALLIQVEGGLTGRFSAGAHHDDHPLGIRCAHIIEQVIFTPDCRGKLIHGFLDDLRASRRRRG